jgi:hypothetical protein
MQPSQSLHEFRVHTMTVMCARRHRTELLSVFVRHELLQDAHTQASTFPGIDFNQCCHIVPVFESSAHVSEPRECLYLECE